MVFTGGFSREYQIPVNLLLVLSCSPFVEICGINVLEMMLLVLLFSTFLLHLVSNHVSLFLDSTEWPLLFLVQCYVRLDYYIIRLIEKV